MQPITFSRISKLDMPIRDGAREGNIDKIAKAFHEGGNIKLSVLHEEEDQLFVAVKKGHLNVVEYLLMAGIYDTKEETLQKLGQAMLCTSKPSIIEFCIKYGCDINTRRSYGERHNLLHAAAFSCGSNDIQNTFIALQNGIFLDAVSSFPRCQTPLEIAIETESKGTFFDEISPILISAQELFGNLKCLHLDELKEIINSLKHEQFGNALNGRRVKDGNTALHVAIENDHPVLVDLLIKAGARTDLPNSQGKTAADMGRTHKNPEIAKLFLKPEVAAPSPPASSAPSARPAS